MAAPKPAPDQNLGHPVVECHCPDLHQNQPAATLSVVLKTATGNPGAVGDPVQGHVVVGPKPVIGLSMCHLVVEVHAQGHHHHQPAATPMDAQVIS